MRSVTARSARQCVIAYQGQHMQQAHLPARFHICPKTNQLSSQRDSRAIEYLKNVPVSVDLCLTTKSIRPDQEGIRHTPLGREEALGESIPWHA